jgi:hypothetical protein
MSQSYPFGIGECVCGGVLDIACHDAKGIATCEDCGMAYAVNIDAEFIDGMWRDRSTVRLLPALPTKTERKTK